MIVIDSSAVVEALVGRDAPPDLLELLTGTVHAPHLLDVEVLSALRGLVLASRLKTPAADAARQDHFAMTITRHDTGPLAERVWALRSQFTAYDATYLALAEGLDAPLVTCDRKLAGGFHHARVRVFRGTR